VCPVKINIHEQLYAWRQVVVQEGHATIGKKTGHAGNGNDFEQSYAFPHFRKGGALDIAQHPLLQNKLNPWYQQRDLPEAPLQSFNEWYRKTKRMSSRNKILEAVRSKRA
jgi:L-lactate dehydrogenase complex protein LldF